MCLSVGQSLLPHARKPGVREHPWCNAPNQASRAGGAAELQTAPGCLAVGPWRDHPVARVRAPRANTRANLHGMTLPGPMLSTAMAGWVRGSMLLEMAYSHPPLRYHAYAACAPQPLLDTAQHPLVATLLKLASPHLPACPTSHDPSSLLTSGRSTSRTHRQA